MMASTREQALRHCAVREADSRGRRVAEEPPRHRGEFARDRDRIIHSAAFRRLEYKTQVFVNHEGDLFRTRLTHTLEVAQIGRSVARALDVNEDLTEAIALAHDLGHAPFGHAGQDALNECLAPWGGFEHNWQSLRVVDELEERYPGFLGLNLMYETREGILKHCTPERAAVLGDVAERFLNDGQPTLEAQIANLADAIAYNSHDIDDGLRAGLIELDELRVVPLCAEELTATDAACRSAPARVRVHEFVRRLIGRQVTDLIESTRAALEARACPDLAAVRAAGMPLVGFGDVMRQQHAELKRFLRQRLYRHYRVHRMSTKAARLLKELFEAFRADPGLLPEGTRLTHDRRQNAEGDAGGVRAIADYLAGMTDRYAFREYERIFYPSHLA